MSEDIEVTELVTKEFTMRLRNAVARSRMAAVVLLGTKAKGLTDEQLDELNEDVQRAAMLADRGFRYGLLCDTGDICGVWMAVEAIIIREEVDGFKFNCATVPGCDAARVCAMNRAVDRKVVDGFKPFRPVILHLPVPYDAMSDGCPMMIARTPAMIEHADACDDTASRRMR